MKNLKVAAVVAVLLVAGNANAADYSKNVAALSAHPATQTLVLAATAGYLIEKGIAGYNAYQSGKLQATIQSAETTLQASVHNIAVGVEQMTDAQAAQVDTALKARAALKAKKA